MVELTIRLPKDDISFVEDYAKANGVSVTEVIDRYLRRMRTLDAYRPTKALNEITGLLPESADIGSDLDQRRRQKYLP